MKIDYNKITIYTLIIVLISTLFVPFICVATSGDHALLINYHTPISFIDDILFDLLLFPYSLSLIALLLIQIFVKNSKTHFVSSVCLTNIAFIAFIVSLFLNCLRYASVFIIILNIVIGLIFILLNCTFIYSFIKQKKLSKIKSSSISN